MQPGNERSRKKTQRQPSGLFANNGAGIEKPLVNGNTRFAIAQGVG